METLHLTPFSHLTDQEYLQHLLDKEEPTAEDVESALRLELLLANYGALLEQIHQLSTRALDGVHGKREALHQIRTITAPIGAAEQTN